MFQQAAIWIGIMFLCGLIAYGGDYWGRRLGKRRASLWGLRPRKTAMLVTAIFGCVIFTVAFGSVVALSPQYRQWAVQGFEALRQLDKSRAELSTKQDELKKLGDEIVVARSAYADVSAKLTDATKARDAVAKQRDAVTLQRDTVAKELEYEKAQAALLKRANIEAQRSLSVANANLRKVVALKNTLSQTNNELSVQNVGFQRVNTRLEKENAGYVADNTRLKSDNSDLRTGNDDLTKEYDSLAQQVAATKLELTNYGDAARLFRTAPVVLPAGREIARLPIAGGGSLEDNLKQIDALMAKARDVAVEEGASPARNGEYAVLPDIAVDDEGNVRPMDPQKVREGVAMSMQRSGDGVLIAYSFVTTVKGEPCLVRLEYEQNPLVYKAGDEVGAATIDTTGTDDDVIKGLVTFVVKDVANSAKARGMIPRVGSPAPLGGVTYGELYHVFEQIREMGNSVRVTAYAKSDMRAADRLDIGFHVSMP